jgi:hypothetical protein
VIGGEIAIGVIDELRFQGSVGLIGLEDRPEELELGGVGELTPRVIE